MRRALLIGLILLFGLMPAAAQSQPAYTIFFIARTLSADGAQVAAEFVVTNGGATAQADTTVELRLLGESSILTTATVPPLAANQTYNLTISFPLSAVANRDEVLTNFEITLTSPEFDEVTRLAEFGIPTPDEAGGVPPVIIPTATPEGAEPPATDGDQQPTTDDPTTSTAPAWLVTAREQLEAWLGFLPVEVDLTDRTQVLIASAVLAVLMILFWLLTVILRAVFVRKPTFPQHPPPYAGMPPLNPDTLPGRRQMWQPVAQHGSMFAEESEGNLHARKLLLGTNEQRYSGWKLVGIRASQYDTYGRVSRTQIILGKPHLNALNRAMARAESLTTRAARQRVKRPAIAITKQLQRKINKRGASLPIALDLKFRGVHGEVMIVFELYQFQVGAWRRLDSWQPDMTVPGRSIYEGYTFTIFGMRSDESFRQFRRRLQIELIDVLAEMLLCTSPSDQPAPTAAPQTSDEHERFRRPPQQATGSPATRQSGFAQAAPTTTSLRPVPPIDDDGGDTVGGAAVNQDTVIRTTHDPEG